MPINRPGGLPSDGKHAPTTGGPVEDNVEAVTVAAARVAMGSNVVLLADGAPGVYNREDRGATADDAPALANRRRDWVFS